MGCDIHAVLERKFDGFGWQLITKLHHSDKGIERDYAFFTQLCGVRAYQNDWDGIPEPKGVPKDISPATKFYIDSWGSDGHSHSWDTALDFVEKKLAIERLRGKTTFDAENDPRPWEMPLANANFVYASYRILSFAIDDMEGETLTEDSELNLYHWKNTYRVIYWFDN